jgi:hypothetical protein
MNNADRFQQVSLSLTMAISDMGKKDAGSGNGGKFFERAFPAAGCAFFSTRPML